MKRSGQSQFKQPGSVNDAKEGVHAESSGITQTQKHVYKIGGITVEFPYKAYGPQVAFMGKVVAALERAYREPNGHCNALLESPTGSGKSLALLCATLAWQQHRKKNPITVATLCTPSIAIPENGRRNPNPHASATSHTQTDSPCSSTFSQAAPVAKALYARLGSQYASSPCIVSSSKPGDGLEGALGSETQAMISGGGFIPEDDTPGYEQDGAKKTEPSSKKCAKGAQQYEKKAKPPTIFYATRTHSQISQVIQEFRKTTYRVPMAVLAARKHYCTNKQVRKKENIDEDCKLLLKDPEHTCHYFKNVNKLKNHSSIQLGGTYEVHDIEDLVKLGHIVKGCAYFSARAMAADAEIVFCPYSYIVNPIIRNAMDVDLRGAIVILDEAHNIEDVARESGSIDLETIELEETRAELEQLISYRASKDYYQPLLEMMQEMLIWTQQQANFLSKRDAEHYSSCWNGDKALHELRAAGISLDSFPILLDCAEKAIKAASEPDEEKMHLSGRAACLIEGLFCALKFMFKSPERGSDYQLVVQKYLKRHEAASAHEWVFSVSLWCLNPGVVFEDVAAASRSIILTSGTLAPLGSFASELGVPFGICMEGPHVIDMDKQIWAAALSVGPGKEPLNASYKHAEAHSFQDTLGAAVENICKVVPGGALIFFPSYKLLDKLCKRWKATGQWARFSEERRLFVEPRGNQEKFDLVLSGYYESITGMKQKSQTLKHAKGIKSGDFLKSKKGQNGGVFMAVCRGKVSEGIDFSDENARVVIVIGIPFPNVKDIQVSLKKEYNNRNKISKNLLGGNQWYCHQAFRALNQAVGRCIRHRKDYGAILLLDERFKQSNYLEYMSKWLRKAITKSDNFEQSLEDLKTFFKTFQVSNHEGSINNHVPASYKRNETVDEMFSASTFVIPRDSPQKDKFSHPSSEMFDVPDSLKRTGTFNELFSASTCVASIDSPKKVNCSHPSTEMFDEFKGRVCDGPFADTNYKKESSTSLNPLSFESCSPSKNQNDEISSLCFVDTCQGEEASAVFTAGQTQNLEASFVNSDSMCASLTTIRKEEKSSDELAEDSWRNKILDFSWPNGYNYSRRNETFDDFRPVSKCLSSFSVEESLVPCFASLGEGPSHQKVDSFQPTDFKIKADKFQPNELVPPMQSSSSKLWVRKCSLKDEKKKDLGSVTSRLFENIGDFDGSTLIEQAPLKINEDLIDGTQTTIVAMSDCCNDAIFSCSTLTEYDEPAHNKFDVPNLTGFRDVTSPTKGRGTESSISVSIENEVQSYHLSCIKCGHSVGIAENNLIVSFYATTLRKSYLNVLKSMQGYSSYSFTPCSSNGREKSEGTVHVYLVDSHELHPSLLKTKEKYTSLQPMTQCGRCMSTFEDDVWVKEDGCVFKPIFCTWCGDANSPIGAHILAADKTNSLLAGKVVIFQEHMRAMPVISTVLNEEFFTKENYQCKQSSSGSASSRYGASRDQCDWLKQEDKYDQSKPKRMQSTTPGKGKLKLPKKDPFRDSTFLFPN